VWDRFLLWDRLSHAGPTIQSVSRQVGKASLRWLSSGAVISRGSIRRAPTRCVEALPAPIDTGCTTPGGRSVHHVFNHDLDGTIGAVGGGCIVKAANRCTATTAELRHKVPYRPYLRSAPGHQPRPSAGHARRWVTHSGRPYHTARRLHHWLAQRTGNHHP